MAMLIIDVDGYKDEHEKIRARELGWALYTGKAVPDDCGSIYFIDPPDQKPIEMKNVWFCASYMHGLPLNPTRRSIGRGALVHLSTDLQSVAVELCRNVLKRIHGSHLFIMHKGGDEGSLFSEMKESNITIVDLESLGCPRVDKIAKFRPDWVIPHCKHHRKTKKHKKFTIIHCPRLEVQIFGSWIHAVNCGLDPLKDAQISDLDTGGERNTEQAGNNGSGAAKNFPLSRCGRPGNESDSSNPRDFPALPVRERCQGDKKAGS